MYGQFTHTSAMDKLSAAHYALLVKQFLAKQEYLIASQKLLELDMYVDDVTKKYHNDLLAYLSNCIHTAGTQMVPPTLPVLHPAHVINVNASAQSGETNPQPTSGSVTAAMDTGNESCDGIGINPTPVQSDSATLEILLDYLVEKYNATITYT